MLDKKLFKLVTQFEVPEYIYEVKVSDKRRTKYYHMNTGPTRKRATLDKIPAKYNAVGFDKDGFAVDAAGNKIIANPKAHGTPRFIPINGQLLYSQNGGEFTRAKVVTALHDFFRDRLIEADFKPIDNSLFPLLIQMEWFYPYSHKTGDITNVYSIYMKTFEDTLTNNGYIPDDEVRYVSGTFPIYTPVKTLEERKLVFRFYQDLRSEVLQLKLKI